MRLRFALLTISAFACIAGFSQAPGGMSYQSLELPTSARAAALGGDNISVIDNDLTLASHNAALLSSVAPNSLALGYMNYIEDVQTFHAGYANALGERGTYGAAVSYVDYGAFSRRDEYDNDLGSFNAKDINATLMYAYDLTDYWSGGIAAKVAYRSYDAFSSLALASDISLNYFDAERELSFSLVARNLGGEVKHFEDRTEKLPVNLLMGFTKKMAHAPFDLSVTLTRLQDLHERALNHLSVGSNIYFSKQLYVALGYNFRRAKEMTIGNSSHGAGFTFGAGLHIKRIALNASYARYHTSGGSLLMDVTYSL